MTTKNICRFLHSKFATVSWCCILLTIFFFSALRAFAAADPGDPNTPLPSIIVVFMSKWGGVMGAVMFLTRFIIRLTPGDEAGKWWALVNGMLGLLGMHSADADRGLKPGQNGGNFPGGVSRILLIGGLAFAFCSSGSMARAQTAGPGWGEWLKQEIPAVITYIASNGAPVSAGWGISADGKTHGTILSQSLGIEALKFHVHKTEVTPGVQHGTFFNSKQDGTDYDLLGLNGMFHWFSLPPWVDSVTDSKGVPIANRGPFNVHELFLKPSVNYPTDRLVQLAFRKSLTLFGIEGGWKF